MGGCEMRNVRGALAWFAAGTILLATGYGQSSLWELAFLLAVTAAAAIAAVSWALATLRGELGK